MNREENHSLYRCYDEKEDLLYVGISISTMRRLSEHKRDSRWYHMVKYITIEQCYDRKDAERKEMFAIKTEFPKFNKAGSVKQLNVASGESDLIKTREDIMNNRKSYLEYLKKKETDIEESMSRLEREIDETRNRIDRLKETEDKLRLAASIAYREESLRAEKISKWFLFIRRIRLRLPKLNLTEKADPDPIIFI